MGNEGYDRILKGGPVMSPQKISIFLSTIAAICIFHIHGVGALSIETSSNPGDPSGAEEYPGVKPGTGNTLPKVTELKNKEGTWVTWPGFSMTEDGGSQIFLQTTGPLAHKMESKKRVIRIKIKRAKIFLKNNRNPLVTTYFNTPIKSAHLKKRGKGVELIVELKESATPTVRQTTGEDGYYYMFLDFPPGQYETEKALPKKPFETQTEGAAAQD